MSKSSDYGGFDVCTLSDRSLYRWLERQEDGFHDLPDDSEFQRLDVSSSGKRLSRIGQRIRSAISKRRRHAYRAT